MDNAIAVSQGPKTSFLFSNHASASSFNEEFIFNSNWAGEWTISIQIVEKDFLFCVLCLCMWDGVWRWDGYVCLFILLRSFFISNKLKAVLKLTSLNHAHRASLFLWDVHIIMLYIYRCESCCFWPSFHRIKRTRICRTFSAPRRPEIRPILTHIVHTSFCTPRPTRLHVKRLEEVLIVIAPLVTYRQVEIRYTLKHIRHTPTYTSHENRTTHLTQTKRKKKQKKRRRRRRRRRRRWKNPLKFRLCWRNRYIK